MDGMIETLSALYLLSSKGHFQTSQKISQQEHFYYRPGSGEEKKKFTTHTLLTLNTCMMDGILPSIYGGMTGPVSERAKRAADFVKEENPDIFVAQEVTLQSSRFLYEELKDAYPHFWVGMGIEPGKKEADLFVASKYPIQGEPIFVPFSKEMQNVYEYPFELNKEYGDRLIERGFFALETSQFWIVTTHLEPGNKEKGLPFRQKQLAFLTDYMDQVAKATGKPYLLAGDLNFARTDDEMDEYASSGIPDLYADPYTEQHPEFDESTFTCTNLFTYRVNGKDEPVQEWERNEIDDYVLIRKPYLDSFSSFEVELLKGTYDTSKSPSEAISDHRAYKAVFILR